MNKKLLGLLIAVAIANPLFAGCKDAVLDVVLCPLTIPIGNGRHVGDLLNNIKNENCAFAIGLTSIIGSKLVVIGGVTAGIVAAVKYYKKKKQLTNENAEQQPVTENTLLQNQNIEAISEAEEVA